MFKASCHPTPRRRELADRIVRAVRGGTPRRDLVEPGKLSLFYINVIMDTERLRDRIRMERFYARRRNLGRPIDMGGPRDVWIDYDIEEDGENVWIGRLSCLAITYS